MTPLWTLGEPQAMNAPRVSFVVPVRNDAARLQTCLRSILRNSHRPGDDRDHRRRQRVDRRLGGGRRAAWARESSDDRSTARVAELRNRGAAPGDRRTSWRSSTPTTRSWPAGCMRRSSACTCRTSARSGALYHAPPDGTWVQRTYGHLRGTPDGQRRRRTGSAAATWRCRGRRSKRSADSTPSLETCEDVDFCHRLRARGLRDRQRRAPEEHPSRRSEDAARGLLERAVARPRQPPGQLPPADLSGPRCRARCCRLSRALSLGGRDRRHPRVVLGRAGSACC